MGSEVSSRSVTVVILSSVVYRHRELGEFWNRKWKKNEELEEIYLYVGESRFWSAHDSRRRITS